MKILIVGNVIGNENYEEDLLVKQLEIELKNIGHITDSFLLPFSRNFLTALDQIFSYRLLEINDCDLLITVGYPACLLKHPNKIVYLFETLPHYWEYWDSEYGILGNVQYSNIKVALIGIDQKILATAKKIYCNSQLLKDDLMRNIGIASEVLYCPPLFVKDDKDVKLPENSIICETNLLPYERPELLIECAKNFKSSVLNIFVPNADIVYMETLEKLVVENKLESKLKIMNTAIPDEVYHLANGYLLTDFQRRKIPNAVVKAMNMGLPVIYPHDSGVIEVVGKYGVEYDPLEMNLIEAKCINHKKKPKIALNTISEFVEILVSE